MQLDRTEIVVRARSAAELFDLSLQVLKRHAAMIAISSAILGWPLLLIDSWAVAWMLREDALLAAERLDQPLTAMRWRHAMHLIALFVMQFPLVSLPTSIYLGHQIFYEPMPLRRLLGRLWPIAGRCLLVLGIARLGLVGLLLEPWVNRSRAFDMGIEFWLIFGAALCALLIRVARPFAPEILGLELCGLRGRRPGEITYRQRSLSLHRYLFSDHLSRFMGAAFFVTLLFASLLAAQLFVIGVSTGLWQWNGWFDYVGLPLSLWSVGLFVAVFRFLSYLDSRIRLEGWEVELRLKAEAARLDPPTRVTTEAKEQLGPRDSVGDELNSMLTDLGLHYREALLMSTPRSRAECTANAPDEFFSAPQGLGLWTCAAHLPHLWSVWLWSLRWTLWLGIGLRMSVAVGSPALAQADADHALRGFPKNSWYDPETQHWIPPSVEPAEDEPLRQMGRISQTPPVPQNTGSGAKSWWDDWAPSWFDLSWLGPWLRVLVFALLAVLLAVSAAVLIHFALRNYLPQRYRRQPSVAGISIDPARIVDLPFDVATVGGDPLAQAKHHMQAGNFDAAIISLYGYLLLVLDQSRLIHLQKGKTNRMYLRELRARPRLHEILQQSMLVFESCYFGKHAVTRQQFMAVWHTVDEFHRLLHAPHSPQPEGTLSAEGIS